MRDEGRSNRVIAMSTHAEFAVILKMNPMFADLGAEELRRISGLCRTQQLAEGEMLFQKGDGGDALYGVRRGQIRIETGASDGTRLTLNFLGPGDLFGEVAGFPCASRTRAAGGDQAYHPAVPANTLDERADGGIRFATALGSASAAALRACVRLRIGGAHFAGAARGVRRRRT